MEFCKKVSYELWDADTRQRVIDFWILRKFKFLISSEDLLIGTRGSLLNNMFAINMQKVKSKVIIRKLDTGEISVCINVDTMYQIITSVEREYWVKELEAFNNYFNNNDLMEEEWALYRKKAKKNNIKIFAPAIIIILACLLFILGVALFA